MNKNKLNVTDPHSSTLEKLSAMSGDDFLDFGSNGLAYIKIVGEKDGKPIYALHAGNADHLATGQDLEVLKAYAHQHNFVAMHVH